MPDRAMVPLSVILSLINDKVLSRKNPDWIYVGLEDIPSSGTALLSHGRATDSVSTNNVFKAGDVLFGKLRPRLRKSIRVDRHGYCSTDILVLRPKENVDPMFAGYVAQSDAVFAKAIRTEEGTKMPRCSWQQIQSAPIYLPDSREAQRKIALVLACVDRAICRSEDLIAKYHQIKTGLMHDLFTRGVVADGQMRLSREQAPNLYHETAIGWLPREWSTCQIQDCGEVKLGRQRSPSQHSGKWTIPYLRVANVFDGFIDFSDVLGMDFTPSEQQTFGLEPGDILLNEGQSLELVGRSAIYRGAPNAYCFQNTLIRFRCNDGQDPAFFGHLFKRWLDAGAFQRIAKQTTSVAHLGADRFARMQAPRVDPEEQQRISIRLNAADSKIAKMVDELHKLEKLKAGLVQDLLTGRVGVARLEPEAVDA